MDDENEEKSKPFDGELTVVAGSMEDWWLIERKVHDGRMWMEPIEHGHALMCSSRITNADIEGAGIEIHGIAKAILDRGEFSAKRCAVRIVGDRAEFKSPRNSLYWASVPLKAADELAAQILHEVPL